MKRKAFIVFALLILTIAACLIASRVWGASAASLIVLSVMCGLFAGGIVLIVQKASRTTWVLFAGLVLLLVLFLPDTTIIKVSAQLPSPLQDPMTFTILVTLPVAVVGAAWLLYAGLNLYKKGQNTGLEENSIPHARRKQTRRAGIVALGLSALVLAKVIYNFYWFMVWDTTNDPLGNLWLIFPVAVVLGSAAVLFDLLRGKAKLAGLAYLLLVPLLIGAAALAQSVDFRQLTAAHAERAKQAIEAYNAREGSYPENIQQLFPAYAISLPGPMIIYGQDWCYEGGKDYYRLGYLDREHWSSPILFGRVYSAAGHSPRKEDVCQAVIDAYRAENPQWEQVLQMYGEPMPTPDTGD